MRIERNIFIVILLVNLYYVAIIYGQTDSIDVRAGQFLNTYRGNWHDMNVPEEDGQVLYDLIIKNRYKCALEIGTSTGHSGVWIARALNLTGGKLITVEIDQERYQTAIKNFKLAGVDQIIDSRLADAHQLVPELDGPFDFVFIDADKTGYKMYAELLLPKLSSGGCLTAHNVRNTYMSGIREFLDFVNGNPLLQTTIDRSSSSGISISYKKAVNNDGRK